VSAIGALDAPGLIFPVSSDPSSRTMRWVVKSLFCQTSESPLTAVAGFGAKDSAPLSATMLMAVVAGAADIVEPRAPISTIQRATVMAPLSLQRR